MGASQPNTSLRQLAREYSDGRIDQPTFRQRRARVLNELAARSPPPRHREMNQITDPSVEFNSFNGGKRKNKKILIGISLTLLILILTGFLLFSLTIK